MAKTTLLDIAQKIDSEGLLYFLTDYAVMLDEVDNMPEELGRLFQECRGAVSMFENLEEKLHDVSRGRMMTKETRLLDLCLVVEPDDFGNLVIGEYYDVDQWGVRTGIIRPLMRLVRVGFETGAHNWFSERGDFVRWSDIIKPTRLTRDALA